MEEGRTALKVLTGKPIGKRPVGRPSHGYYNGSERNGYQFEELG